jgi:hypothetical protein
MVMLPRLMPDFSDFTDLLFGSQLQASRDPDYRDKRPGECDGADGSPRIRRTNDASLVQIVDIAS